MVAKVFYFQALRKFLDIKFPLDKIYIWLTFLYSGVSIYFMIRAQSEGMGAYFDLTKPELSGLALRERLLPYGLSKTVKILFLPNYLLGFVFYCYLTIVAIKRREKLIAMGVLMTLASILYTNSYHFFKNEYWIPLNILADVLEMLRLSYVQKNKITSKLIDYNNELESLNEKINQLENSNKRASLFKHDTKNSLYASSLQIYKAKLLLKKQNIPQEKEIVNTLDLALDGQRMAASIIEGVEAHNSVCMDSLLRTICDLHEVAAQFESLGKINTRCSQSEIERIITNLVKNSKEASQGGSSLMIRATLEEDGQFQVLKISDSGDFNKMANPERVFEKGFSTKAEKGRGLGLYSVKYFMESIGGDAQLVNDDGRVCFCLKFPKI